MTVLNNLTWKIGGEAGHGILNAGMMFAKTAMRGGLNAFASAEYPSLIRGGHNHLDVRISGDEAFSHLRAVNVLVALNKDTFSRHKDKVTPKGGIIFDGEKDPISPEELGRADVKLFPLPLDTLARDCGGKIMRNTIAIGATMALVDFDIELFNSVLRSNFSRKGDAIVEQNIKAARIGHDYIKQNFKEPFEFKLEKRSAKGHILLSGNEALALGAIKAGCRFISSYPMTPASSVMMVLAKYENDCNVVVKQTEDEIAALNMAIGAAYTGARSMVATSGGGFSLMVEALGLASQTETPVVIVEAQRPGPATGMATHSSQGDLRFILHASTDEAPRIIIEPGDVNDCFYNTIDAFNLAEKYQMPVFIITDKYLAESYLSVAPFKQEGIKIERGKLLSQKELDKIKNYKRYTLTKDGISPRSIPGMKGGRHVASSYEHDEEGFEREEEEIKIEMSHKRFKKLEMAAKEVPEPELVGDEDAAVTILAWGSTKGPILEAMRQLRAQGIKTNYLQVIYLSPFPVKKVKQVLQKAEKTVVIENNQSGQMAGMIREYTGKKVDHLVLKYDGRPFFPLEIVDALKSIATEMSEMSRISEHAQKSKIFDKTPEVLRYGHGSRIKY